MNESWGFWRTRAALVESPQRALSTIAVGLVILGAAAWWSIAADSILPLILIAVALTAGLFVVARMLLKRDVSETVLPDQDA